MGNLKQGKASVEWTRSRNKDVSLLLQRVIHSQIFEAQSFLSFATSNFVAKGGASAGKGTVLGSGLSSSLKGGESLGGLGDATNSMAAVGSKPMKSGAAGGPAPSGFFSKMKAGITSRLGGDAEKGKFGQLITGLGGKLAGALGGGDAGKQGTGAGDKPGGGAGGGGITSTLLKGLSSRLGGDENTEPLANILNNLSGKIIDKAGSIAFVKKLLDKIGGTEEAKKKVLGLIAGLDTKDLTQKLTVLLEGDEKNEGLINKAKTKLFAFVGIKPPVENIGTAEAGAAETEPVEEKPPEEKPAEPEPPAEEVVVEAFGEAEEPTEEPEEKPQKKTKLKQGKVFLQVQTTLGEDDVVLSEFTATEGISELFECTAIMMTDKNDVNLQEMLGKPITVLMEFEALEASQEPPGRFTPLLSKAADFFDQIKNRLGRAQKVNPQQEVAAVVGAAYLSQMLTFGIMDSIKGFFGKGGQTGGKSPALGSGLSSSVGGGESLGGLGDATNSMAAVGGKPMNSGAAGGPAPTGFFGKIKAGIASRLGGDAEKGKIGELLTGLGGKLSGALGGGEAGKQGTGAGDKPGEGAAGGGITATVLKGLSSRLGGDENTEPLAGIMKGLSGKIIDKARGNAFINKLLDKVGGSEEAKKKVNDLIGGLDTAGLTKKLSVLVEGDEKTEGLITKAKNKLFAFVGIQPPVENIGTAEAGAAAEKPAEVEVAKEEPAQEDSEKKEPAEPEEKAPAFGEEEEPEGELDQRDTSKSIRYFNGIVGEIVQGPTDRTDSQMTVYTVKFYPKLWLLKHSRNCRIFQKMTAMEIIAQILQENNITDVSDKTKERGKDVRDFCVQYNESDFDFISRLMEFEGIFYYFLHTEDSHILVLADSPDAHHQCPHTKKALVQEKPYGQSDFNCVQLAELVSRVVPGKQALSDYNFELPSNNLFSDVKGKGFGGRIYSYPGSYENKTAGENFARMRMEADELPKDMLYGLSTIPYMEPGSFFKLKQHVRAEANKKYVVYQVRHHAMQEAEDNNYYSNKFSAFDYQGGPFRPALRTPSPKIYGTQTARVTGKEGEEIWTDEYGRVKVKFHWDENTANDENTSCWVRVSQGWAGNGWGMLFTPRIGQEVVVTFLEGDPDKPLITGSVYNGEKKAPYLPDQPTISTIKSNSTKDAEGFNELRFQDLAENEEIYIHAQKDLNTDIVNNRTETIERGTYTQNILTGDRVLNLKGETPPKLSQEATENNEEVAPTSGTDETTPEIKGTGNDTIILDRGSVLEHLKGKTILEKEEQDKKDGKEPEEDEEEEAGPEPQVDTSKDRSGQGDLTTILSRGDRSLMIEKGDETRILKKGNRTLVVRGGDEIRSVSGDVKQTIGKNYTLNIMGDLDINVTGDIRINGANITATTNPKEVELPEYLLPPQIAQVLGEKTEEEKKEEEKEKEAASLPAAVQAVVSKAPASGNAVVPENAESEEKEKAEEEKFKAVTQKLGILSSVTSFAVDKAKAQAEKGGKFSKVFELISQHGGNLSEQLKQIVADREAGKKESSEGGVGGVAVKAITAGTAFFSKKEDGSPSEFSNKLKKLKAFKFRKPKADAEQVSRSGTAMPVPRSGDAENDSGDKQFESTTQKLGILTTIAGAAVKAAGSQAEKGGKFSSIFKIISEKGSGLTEQLQKVVEDRKAGKKESSEGGVGGVAVKAITAGTAFFSKKEDGSPSDFSNAVKKLKAFKIGKSKGKDGGVKEGEEATGGLSGMLSGLNKIGGEKGQPGEGVTGGVSGMLSGLGKIGGEKGEAGEGVTGGAGGMLSGLGALGGGGEESGGMPSALGGLLGGGKEDEESGGAANVIEGAFGGDKEESELTPDAPKGAIKFISKTYDVNAEESISGTALNVTSEAKLSNTMKAGSKALVSGDAVTNIQGGTVKVD